MNRIEKFASFWTAIYGVYLFTFFLWFTWDGYFNILEAKTMAFAVGSVIYLLIGIIPALYLLVRRVKTLHMSFIWLLFFAVSCMLSSLFSGNMAKTMTAVSGKRFGLIVLMLCILSCFVSLISANGIMNHNLSVRNNTGKLMDKSNIGIGLWILLLGCWIGTVSFSVLTVCNRFGVDPLGFYLSIDMSQVKGFLSTFGQINLVSEFLCVCLPLWVGVFLKTKNPLSAIAVFFTMMAGLASGSEGFFVGIAVTMILYLYFAVSDRDSIKENLRAYTIICIIITFAVFALWCLNQIGESTVEWETLHRFFLVFPGWICAFIFCAALFAWDHFLEKQSCKYAGNIVTGMILVIVILIVVLMILCTSGVIFNDNMWTKYFCLGDNWGTNRGFVWIRTIKLWIKRSWKMKLFGSGLGTFRTFFKPYYKESMSVLGYFFSDAHNEVLQFLVTTGLFGCVTYYGFMVSVIRKCFKENQVIAAILFVWLFQSMFNNPLVLITPYIFYVAGLGAGLIKNDIGNIDLETGKKSSDNDLTKKLKERIVKNG